MSTTDEQRLREADSWFAAFEEDKVWDKATARACFIAGHALGHQAALAQQAPTPAVLTEPAAWIEHHKGGDNLIWEPQKGSPRVTPLYTHPAVSEPAAPVVPTSLEDMRALLATAPAVSREAEPAAPVDARDANARRYEWLRERVEVRQMAAITGTVRPAIEVGIGCAFFDSRIPKSYPPEAGIERSAKLDAAIDAAIDAALTRQAAAPAEGEK